MWWSPSVSMTTTSIFAGDMGIAPRRTPVNKHLELPGNIRPVGGSHRNDNVRPLKPFHQAVHAVMLDAGRRCMADPASPAKMDVVVIDTDGLTNDKPLPAGAVISAEPGIYLPGRFGVLDDPGRRLMDGPAGDPGPGGGDAGLLGLQDGVVDLLHLLRRIEDVVVVKEDGCVDIMEAPHELIVL